MSALALEDCPNLAAPVAWLDLPAAMPAPERSSVPPQRRHPSRGVPADELACRAVTTPVRFQTGAAGLPSTQENTDG